MRDRNFVVLSFSCIDPYLFEFVVEEDAPLRLSDDIWCIARNFYFYSVPEFYYFLHSVTCISCNLTYFVSLVRRRNNFQTSPDILLDIVTSLISNLAHHFILSRFSFLNFLLYPYSKSWCSFWYIYKFFNIYIYKELYAKNITWKGKFVCVCIRNPVYILLYIFWKCCYKWLVNLRYWMVVCESKFTCVLRIIFDAIYTAHTQTHTRAHTYTQVWGEFFYHSIFHDK